jgi:hypothetical protein
LLSPSESDEEPSEVEEEEAEEAEEVPAEAGAAEPEEIDCRCERRAEEAAEPRWPPAFVGGWPTAPGAATEEGR